MSAPCVLSVAEGNFPSVDISIEVRCPNRVIINVMSKFRDSPIHINKEYKSWQKNN